MGSHIIRVFLGMKWDGLVGRSHRDSQGRLRSQIGSKIEFMVR